jgi:hypothetical protein
MKGLHSLLHTVGFFFYFLSSPICALHEADKLDQGEGEGEREADRGA